MNKTLLIAAAGIAGILPLASQASDNIPADILGPTYISYQLVGEGHDLRGLEFENGVYEARLGGPDGRLSKVAVDPRSGQVLTASAETTRHSRAAAPKVSATDAIQTVAMQGYWDIVELKHRDGVWRVEARDDAGVTGAFRVDAETGAMLAAKRR